MPYNPQDYIKNGVDTNSDNYLKVAQRAFNLIPGSNAADFNTSNRNSYMNLAQGYLTGDQSIIGDKGADHPLTKAFNQAIGEFQGGNMGQMATDTSSIPVVNTNQPSPTTVNATPFTQQNLNAGFQAAQTSGMPPPQEGGSARTAIQNFTQTAATTPTFYLPNTPTAGYAPETIFDKTGKGLSYDDYIKAGGKADFSNVQRGSPPVPQQPTQLNGIEQQLAADPGYQQLLKDYAEYNNVANQTKSLADTYQQIIKSSGLEAINTELLNTKRVIEGTEDDIRNEVKAANGFATDSQVLALASARNKTLIKNYNALVDQQASIQNQVNTMVNLAGQDRNFALQSIQQKLQIDQQINEYRDKFVSNAKEGYNNYIKAVGYSGLYNALANDPQSLAMVERTLSLPSGTIREAAIQENQIQRTAQEQQNFENAIKSEQLNISQQGLAINKAQLGVSQFNAETARMNALKDFPQPGEIPDKVISKLQSSNEYKTIAGLLPAVQAIKSYGDLVKKEGTYAFPGTAARGDLQSAYGNALSAWKTLAGLGALSGADFALAENAIPSTGLFKSNTKATAQLNSSLDNAVTQAQNLTKRLSQLYPEAGSLLTSQLDDILVSAYPAKYQVDPTTGQVYENTGVDNYGNKIK